MKKLILGLAATSFCALSALPGLNMAAFAGQTAPSNSQSTSLQQAPYTNPLFSGDFADAVNAYDGGHYTRALAMFQKLAQNNDGPALYWLSNMHRSGYKVQKSIALSETYLNRALPIIRQNANEDDPRALYYLSGMYDTGRGVKASRKKFLRNLKRATELGYTEAYLKMAKQYRLGKGVKKDTAKALAYKNKAADQGYVEAMYELAENYSVDYRTYNIDQDFVKTRQYYQRAANNGHLVSMQRLGFMHLRGDGGKHSPIEAKAWFVKARDGGYEYNPGAVSMAEQAIEKDKEKEKAANALSERKITTKKLNDSLQPYYDAGALKINAKNYVEAIAAYRYAADRGHAPSQAEMGAAYMYGIGVEENFYQSRVWLNKAAAQGDADGMFLLGNIYYNGLGVTKDEKKALKWYQKAAAKGHTEGIQAVDTLTFEEPWNLDLARGNDVEKARSYCYGRGEAIVSNDVYHGKSSSAYSDGDGYYFQTSSGKVFVSCGEFWPWYRNRLYGK